jgi:hypothetical protein
MNEWPPRRIVITKEELQDRAIDEVLALRHADLPGPVQAKPQATGLRFFYAGWFYLLMAGALGAAGAWVTIEPFFDDGIVFAGRVEEVNAAAVPVLFGGTTHEIRGLVQVSGVSVYVVPTQTRVLSRGSTPRRVSLTDLRKGDTVKVMALPTPDPNSLLAVGIRPIEAAPSDDGSLRAPALVRRQTVAAFLLFPVVAGFVGFMIGSVEGIVCRTLARAAWCGAIGLLSGVLGGALSGLIAGAVFEIIGRIAGDSLDPTASAAGFIFLLFRRGLAWTVAGMAMGLGQGLALKSSKLLLNGFIGGMVGGLMGGLLFDPIDLLLSDRELLEGAEVSRATGLVIIGAAVGAMIGVTDLLTRDAWLKVVTGPLRGKEFSFDRSPIRLGSSTRNEIYLFRDPKIDPVHAEITRLRDTYELADLGSSTGTFVNGRRIKRARLAEGDRITIGDSAFLYSSREKRQPADPGPVRA